MRVPSRVQRATANGGVGIHNKPANYRAPLGMPTSSTPRTTLWRGTVSVVMQIESYVRRGEENERQIELRTIEPGRAYSVDALGKKVKVLKVNFGYVLGPKLFFVTGLVIFTTAVARLVCLDLLG